MVEQLGERGLVVCANGASIYDPARHELVDRTDLDPDVVRSIVDDVERHLPEAVVGVEQGFEFAADTSIERTNFALLESWKLQGMRIGPIRSFLDEPVTKLIVRLPDDTEPGAAARVQALVGDRALVTHSTTESFLELSHPSVHKASTVERLLLRHEELQRTNALLVEQVHALQAERDSLKSRLLAARARIDALLERLPATEDRKERT